MGLFIKKPLADLMTEANDSGSKSLKRILGPWSLIALGVGVIIGAAFGAIVTSFTESFINPLIACIGGTEIAGLPLLYLSLSPP